MYVLKNMVPISDPRKLTDKANMFYDYRNGITDPTERELFLLKQLREGPCYDSSRIVSDPVPGGNKRITKHDYDRSI
jgi:hypothetical protein